MLYCFLDMAHGRCNCCFLFWAILSLFTPLQPEKWKCQNKWKNPLRYHHLTQVYQKNDLMLDCSWDTAHGRCNCYFSFSTIVCPFTPPNSPENQNFKKPNNKKKTPGDIILNMCIKNCDYMMYGFWDMVRSGQTDGKSDI